jgi:hypothetical protein
VFRTGSPYAPVLIAGGAPACMPGCHGVSRWAGRAKNSLKSPHRWNLAVRTFRNARWRNGFEAGNLPLIEDTHRFARISHAIEQHQETLQRRT